VCIWSAIAYRENTISHATCKRWYLKFRQGDFNLEDELRAGRPQKIETDELQTMLDTNSAQTEKELAEQLGVTQQAVSVCLYTMGKVQREGSWFRMNYPKTTKIDGVALTLLSKFRKKNFLHKIIRERWKVDSL